MYGYIYKTTNTANGKIYVGQKKSKKFLGNAYLGSGRYLKSAVKHYGEESFTVELLEWANSAEELNALEKAYIEKLCSTCHEVGYNITKGAVGGDTYSGLSDKDKKRRLERQKNTLKKNPRKYATIHKGSTEKRVDVTVLEKYLNEGWERGRSLEHEKKLAEGHKGLARTKEWKEKIAFSVWEGKTRDEQERLRKIHSEKTKEQMKNTPREVRVERARNANKFKGHKCTFVNNGEQMHFIIVDELQHYLDMGYEVGMLKRGKK